MTSEQIATIVVALISLITGIAGSIKWGAGRITKAIDTNGTRIEKNTDAMIANTHSNAVLATKIDSIATFVHHATPSAGVQQQQQPQQKKRAQTKPQLVAVPEDEGDSES